MKKFLKNPKIAYGFYDFANSAYWGAMARYLAPLYFTTLFAEEFSAGSWWLANSVSALAWMTLWLAFGRYGDANRNHLAWLSVLASLCFFSLFALALSVWQAPKIAITAFVAANAFFIASLGIYDALLKKMAKASEIHEISGFWWWMGFLWGVIGTIGILFLQKAYGNFHPAGFFFIAGFFWIFAALSLWNLKNCDCTNDDAILKPKETTENQEKIGFGSLIWYWLISHAIAVTLLFFWIYAVRELWFSTIQVWIAVLFVQIVGIPGTLYGSRLFNRFGFEKSLFLLVGMWTGVIALLVLPLGIWWFAGSLVLAGLSLGNIQSLMRAQFAIVSNASKIWRDFWWFLVSTQAAVLLWPVAYGYLSDYVGSQKIPMALSAAVMVAWAFLLRKRKNNQTISPHSSQDR